MALARDDSSVQMYLTILQGIKNRLAGNSASCKTWCITIVAAILVLALDKSKPGAALVGLIPVVFLFLLDAYYLSLERDIRDIYNSFVEDLHAGTASETRVYSVKPEEGCWHRVGSVAGCCISLSVAPFYGMLAIAVVVAWRLTSGHP